MMSLPHPVARVANLAVVRREDIDLVYASGSDPVAALITVPSARRVSRRGRGARSRHVK